MPSPQAVISVSQNAVTPMHQYGSLIQGWHILTSIVVLGNLVSYLWAINSTPLSPRDSRGQDPRLQDGYDQTCEESC